MTIVELLLLASLLGIALGMLGRNSGFGRWLLWISMLLLFVLSLGFGPELIADLMK